MFNQFLNKLLIAIILFIIVVSCKKDKDTLDPVISFYSPFDSQQFSVSDTILIEAKVADDKIIENIKVVLVNENFIPVLNAIYITPTSNTYNISMIYPLYDLYMESGIYYVLIRAFDGTNSKNQYQKILLDEIPQQIDGVIVLTQAKSHDIEVLKLDSSFAFNSLFFIDGDYSASAVSSRYNQLYVTGHYHLSLKAFDLKNYEVDWFVEPFINPPYYDYDCLYYSDFLYVSFYNYYIKAYDSNGSDRFSATLSYDELPSKIFRHNDYVIIDKQSKVGGNTYISVYYFISGVLKQELNFDYKVVDFFTKDNDNIYVLANSYNQGTLKIYDLSFNNIFESFSMPEGKILSAEQIDYTKILIAYENTVYHYESVFNILTTFIPDVTAYKIQYDKLNKHVYIAENQKVSVYTYPEAVLKNTVTIADSILNIHLLYNK
ncbi:MAG: hypothetical protein K8R58_04965 [Bacteroidales bacterium]|nr:hypothetical protein [Bacteroidales bacterium]